MRRPRATGRAPRCTRDARSGDRCIAACPAELPPPTMYTSSPASACASDDRRAVEDARAGQLLELGDVERAGTPRRWRGSPRGRSPLPSRELHDVPAALEARMPVTALHQQEPGAEHPRLLVGALRQLGAAHAAREAEVVADQRARAGLAADRLALDRERRAGPRRTRTTAAARPAGPAPITTTSKSRSSSSSRGDAVRLDQLLASSGPRATAGRRNDDRHVGRRSHAALARGAAGPPRESRGVEDVRERRCGRAGWSARAPAATSARRPPRPPGAGRARRRHSWRNSVIVRWKNSSGDAHGFST